MGSKSEEPPKQDPPPPPVRSTGADAAQAAQDQKRLEKDRYSIARTILRNTSAPLAPAPEGTRTTL